MIQDRDFYKNLNTGEGATTLTMEVNQGIYLNQASNILLVPAGGQQQHIKPSITPAPTAEDPNNVKVGPVMTFIGTQNLDVDGTIEGKRYGFILDGQGRAMTFKFDKGSFNVAIRKTKLMNSSFASFAIKNELETRGCEYLIVDDCWSVDSEGECFYIGTSKSTWLDALGITQVAGMVERVYIENCTGENAGWDHCQIKQAVYAYVNQCLFLNAATANHGSQNYMIMVGRNHELHINKTIFSKSVDMCHLHRECPIITFTSCLFDDWGKGIYSEADQVIIDDCDFKDMAKIEGGNSAVFMRGNILVKNSRFDSALRDKLQVPGNKMLNLVIEDSCTFVDLPKLELVRTYEGEPCVKPGSHYHGKGWGKIFQESEVDMSSVVTFDPAPRPEPVPEPVPTPDPDPVPTPDPDPVPTPDPEPVPTPEPEPTPPPAPAVISLEAAKQGFKTFWAFMEQ